VFRDERTGDYLWTRDADLFRHRVVPGTGTR